MRNLVHKLCEKCKHKCKQFTIADIMSCKYLTESAEARKINAQCTKEYEARTKITDSKVRCEKWR